MPLFNIKIRQEVSDKYSNEFIEIPHIFERKTTYCGFGFIPENETNEANDENSIKILKDGFNSSKNYECNSCFG